MEDVLEQIVGEIWDETDEVVSEVTEKAPNEFEIDGDMPIGDFLEEFGRERMEDDIESATVGGWMMELYRGFPAAGELISFEDMHFTVLQADDRRVEKVLLHIDPPEEEK